MKKLKYLVLSFIVVLGIIITPTVVNAASTEMIYEVSPISWTKTRTIIKKSWAGQKVKVLNAYTAMTDPCPKCDFEFMLYNEAMGKTEGSLTLKMNQTGAFPGDTDMPPGRYYMKVKRADVTALPTMVSFKWTY